MAEHLAAHLLKNLRPAGDRASGEQLHDAPFNFLYIRFLRLSQNELLENYDFSLE